MYTLYHNKKEKIIKVSKCGKALQNCNYTDEVTRYNDCYFLCKKRKPLIDFANSLKEKWLIDAEKEVEEIRNITIGK